MPLIKCKECDKEISDTAEVCPHCGAETELTKEKKEKKHVRKIRILIFVGIFVGLLATRALHVKKENEMYERLFGPEAMRGIQNNIKEIERLQRELDQLRGR